MWRQKAGPFRTPTIEQHEGYHSSVTYQCHTAQWWLITKFSTWTMRQTRAPVLVLRFYMIKINIHSSVVHDILWFPGKCALTSSAKALQMPRSHRGSNLLTCLSLSSKMHLHETLSFPSGPVSSHIKTKNRGKYFIYAVSANVSRHDAWQIIEKWFLMSLSQTRPMLFIFSVNH